ncbi:MAG: hypothetical protein K2O28_01840 [Clostridia bacterium]|nr:hypothetical protein [Clostridia bacterium]
METNEKTCENCKHYVSHYVICNVRLAKVGGHCCKSAIRRCYVNRIFTPRKDCKYWEEAAPLKEERVERALNEISKIKRTLSDIALILKNEK